MVTEGVLNGPRCSSQHSSLSPTPPSSLDEEDDSFQGLWSASPWSLESDSSDSDSEVLSKRFRSNECGE